MGWAPACTVTGTAEFVSAWVHPSSSSLPALRRTLHDVNPKLRLASYCLPSDAPFLKVGFTQISTRRGKMPKPSPQFTTRSVEKAKFANDKFRKPFDVSCVTVDHIPLSMQARAGRRQAPSYSNDDYRHESHILSGTVHLHCVCTSLLARTASIMQPELSFTPSYLPMTRGRAVAPQAAALAACRLAARGRRREQSAREVWFDTCPGTRLSFVRDSSHRWQRLPSKTTSALRPSLQRRLMLASGLRHLLSKSVELTTATRMSGTAPQGHLPPAAWSTHMQ